MTSTMLDVNIDRQDPTDFFEQVAGRSAEQSRRARRSRASVFLPRRTSPRTRRQHKHGAPRASFAAGRRLARVSARSRISVVGTPERGAVVRARRSSSRSHVGRAIGWTSSSRSSRTSASAIASRSPRCDAQNSGGRRRNARVANDPEGSPLGRALGRRVAAVALATSPPAGTSGTRGPTSPFDYDRSAPLEVAWAKPPFRTTSRTRT